jgi:hypothetical protein
MKKNTLTTLGKLKAGDIFTRPNNEMKFIKVDGLPPVRNAKHLFECFALPVGGIRQRMFKANTEVIYLFTSLSVV